MLWQKMEWLDESDHDDRFGSIRNGYCKAMQRAYDAEVSQYIGELKSKLQGKKSEGKKYHHAGNINVVIHSNSTSTVINY